MYHLFSAIISQHSDEIEFQKILDFHTYMTSSTYNKGLSKLMFFMYGGSKDRISRKDFIENLNVVVKNLCLHFTDGENLIMRNSQFIKNKEDMKRSFDDSITVLANFQNKNYVQ